MRRLFFVLFAFLVTLAWGRSALANHPLPLVNLGQTNNDLSALCAGCTANSTTVRINGSSDAATCASETYSMDVEVRLTGVAFSGVATNTVSMTKATCALTAYPTVVVSGLAAGSYKWQARERTTTGGSGTWAAFNGGATAFVIGSTLSVTPTTLAFGNQRVGTPSAAQTVTLQAIGGSVTVNTITNTGPYAVSGITLPRTLTAGATATFSVTFTPTATGSSPGTITINSTAGSKTVSLTGTGIASDLALSPSPTNFGSVRVGSTSAPITITATNTGTATLNTTTMTFTGPFAHSGGATAGFTLAPGASTTFSVVFSPTAEGAATGSVSIVSDAPASPTVGSLTGTGILPKISVAPASIAFGDQRVGTTSAPTSVTISNPGTATLTVSAITGTAPFRAFGLVLPANIAPGASAVFAVEFKPTAIGAAVGTVTIDSNAATSPTSLSLTGRGTGGVAVVSPSSIAFGSANVGATLSSNVTVRNDGNADLKVNSVAFAGTHAADFNTTTTLPITIAPGASGTITLTFTPGAIGARNGTANITTDDPITPGSSVSLSGTGTSPKIAITPASLAFGDVLVGTTSGKLTVKIDNTGDGVLTVTGAALGGTDAARFTLDPVTLPLKIAGGSSATLSVAYSPDATTANSAKLAITSDDPSTPSVEVPLAGTGISPKLTVTPTSIDFGAQLVARVSSARTVEVRNDGTASLDVTALTISGTDASAFALVSPPGLPSTIAPGAKLTLSITIKPSVIGAHSAALDIVTSGGAGKVTLAGVGISSALSVTPATLEFGTIKAPGSVGPKTVTITNTSADTLTLKEGTLAAMSGFTATSFAGDLAAGASKTVDITFNGAMAGDYAATLTIETTDTTVPTATVKLTGKALSSWLAVNPTTLEFGEVRVSESSGEQTVTVTNQSTVAIKIAAATTDDPSFVVSGLDLKTAIEPGKSISFGVGFLPTSVGDKTGKLGLTVEGASTPEVFVTLKGKGIDPMSAPDAGPVTGYDAGDLDNPGLPESSAGDASGCSCTMPGNTSSGIGAALAILGIALALRRRR